MEAKEEASSEKLEVKASNKLKELWKEYPSFDVLKKGKTKKSSAPSNSLWVVMEKVHGANFSFMCDGTDLVCARRTQVLEPFETFYHWQEVRDRYKANIFELYKDIKQALPDTSSIVVFGELFGGIFHPFVNFNVTSEGIYPHPEVKDIGKQPIQRGVYYTPSIEFYAFDIRIHDSSDKARWLNYHDALKYFKKHEIFHAVPLKEGTLEECMQFDIKINSTIPARLGLPPLEKNQMEGVVIKCVEESEPLHGAYGKRSIWKHKNAKFAEVNPPAPESLYEKQKRELKEAEERAYEELERYINVNRLDNLQSKIGPVTSANQAEAAELLLQDAIKDFVKDNEKLWLSIDEEKREKISRNSASKVRSFIATWLQEQSSKP